MTPEIIEIPSPNFTVPTPARGGRHVGYVVLHTTESPERDGAALAVAKNWFGRLESQASAHYVVDDKTIVQCVKDENIAWHARGCNQHSIGVELVGSASQDRSGWGDTFSVALLERAAWVVARACRDHGIPTHLLSSTDLLSRFAGITTHAAVSAAWRKSDHYDPGPHFPGSWFIERVRGFM